MVKKLKKEYNIGDTASLRLSKASGATGEVINWINGVDDKCISVSIINSIKITIALEQHYTKSQISRLLQGVSATTIPIEQHIQHKDVNEACVTKDNVDNKEKIIKDIGAHEIEEVKDIKSSSSSEEELFGDDVPINKVVEEIRKKPVNKGMKAFNSIGRSSK